MPILTDHLCASLARSPMDMAPASTHIRLVLTATPGMKPRMIVKNLPRRTNRGTHGGCGMPAIQAQAMYSPLSQKLTLLAMVNRYTSPARNPVAVAKILSIRTVPGVATGLSTA